MSITREQFLAGIKFQYKTSDHVRYEFVPTSNRIHQGFLRETYGNDFKYSDHHANVDIIQKTRFRSYATRVGKCVHYWSYFADMIIIDEPKKEPNGNEQAI